MAGADAAARTAATKPALDAKIKVEPEAGLRRKGAAQSVAPLPEKLARRLAQTADPAQGGSPAAVGGIAAKSAGGPVPAAPAQAGWPEEAGEPGA